MKSSRSRKAPQWNRRDFIKTTSLATGAVVFGVPTLLRAQNLNSKLNIAAIGVGGKGSSDIDCSDTENIVALCDVQPKRAADQLRKHPNAKYFGDFRKMLDEMGKGIDAVIVSTPDHFHAIAAAAAMRLGKAVYCQKPLTQTVHEARHLRNLAKETGVVTQMGNQGSAADGLRRAVECIQAGLIGQVHTVHIWTNRPIWPQGMGRPEGADPIPEGLDWDTWIGPAPMRPYHRGYEPFNWRGWLDFGTGALGDMACHTVNMPFRALNLGHPTEVEGVSLHGMNQETYPIGSTIRFQFPARKTKIPAAHRSFFHRHDVLAQDAMTLWWYDGGQPKDNDPTRHDGSNKPPQDVTTDIVSFLGEVPGSGCLIIGSKGQVFSPDDYGEQFYVKMNDEKKFTHYKKYEALASIPETLPRNAFKGDNDRRQHQEWIQAIKDNKPEACYSQFAVAAQLAEIMLLGCVSLRVGKRIDWDGPRMRVTNAPEAALFIKRDNRAGWVLA